MTTKFNKSFFIVFLQYKFNNQYSDALNSIFRIHPLNSLRAQNPVLSTLGKEDSFGFFSLSNIRLINKKYVLTISFPLPPPKVRGVMTIHYFITTPLLDKEGVYRFLCFRYAESEYANGYFACLALSSTSPLWNR